MIPMNKILNSLVASLDQWPSKYEVHPTVTKHEFLHHSRSSDIWIQWVAGNNILRRFYHQELCQLKVYVLYSSQKANCFTCHCGAKALRSGGTCLEFFSLFSVSPQLSWHCGIAFHSCQSRDNLGSSLGRSLGVTWRWPISHSFNRIIKKVAFADCFLNYWNGLEWPELKVPAAWKCFWIA